MFLEEPIVFNDHCFSTIAIANARRLSQVCVDIYLYRYKAGYRYIYSTKFENGWVKLASEINWHGYRGRIQLENSVT